MKSLRLYLWYKCTKMHHFHTKTPPITVCCKTSGVNSEHWGWTLPLPYPHPFPSPLPCSPSLRIRLPLIQLGGLRERYKLPQRGLGRSPNRNWIWWILALKPDICMVSTILMIFWESNEQISCSLNTKGKLAPNRFYLVKANMHQIWFSIANNPVHLYNKL